MPLVGAGLIRRSAPENYPPPPRINHAGPDRGDPVTRDGHRRLGRQALSSLAALVMLVAASARAEAQTAAGVTVSPTAVTATEGGATGSYTVVLDTQPSGTVTVTVGDTSDDISASPTTLTFTTVDWNTAQTVTVTADDDNVAEGEETATLTHTVTSTDSDYDGVTVVDVTVTVTDNDGANNAPVFAETSPAARSVAENTAAAQDIGTAVSATDADNDTLTYTLEGTDAASFDIVSGTGQIQTKAALDYETKASYSVTVKADDGRGGSATIAVTISITDVLEAPNNAPVFTDDATLRDVAENTASNMDIGTAVSATDADSDTLTYSLQGTDEPSFTIVSTSGQLQTSAALDHEAKESYQVTVKADDGKGGSDTIAVVIRITDVDEPPAAPAAPLVSATTGTLDSLDVSWTAPDNAGKPEITAYRLRYRVETTTMGSWTSDPEDHTGTSATIGGLTADTTYEVRVRATNNEGNSTWSDSGTGSTDAPAPITPPTPQVVPRDWDLIPARLGGGDSFRLLFVRPVGTQATSSDLTSYNEKVQRTARNGHESIRDYSSHFRALASTDYHDARDNTATTGAGVPIYYLDGAKVADNYADFYDGSWNSTSPTNHRGEAITGAEVSVWTGSGGDGTAATLVGQPGSSAALGAPGGNSRIGRADLAGFNISHDAQSQTTNFPLYGLSPVFTVTAGTDATLTSLTLSGATLNETFASDTYVYTANVVNSVMSVTVAAETNDSNASSEYLDENGTEIVDADGGATGHQVNLAEGANIINIKVTAEDANTILTYGLTVTRTPAVPVWAVTVDPDTIAEADTGVSTVTVSTGGVSFPADQTITLAFTDSTATLTDDYTVAETTLTLTAGTTSVTTTITAVDDAVEDADEEIKITAMYDGSAIGAQQTITITDDDAPNNVPVFTETSPVARSVAENTAAEEDIGTAVSATDADNDTLTYTLEGTDAASFDIVSGTGQIRTKAPLDYETKSSYSVTVKADDGQGGSATIAVTISITDVPDAPNSAPVFTETSPVARSVAENTAAEEDIGTAVSATDADNDTLTYTLEGTDAASFDIVSGTGQIRTKAPLDYETKSSYDVTVKADDGQGGSTTIAVTISITDVLEAPGAPTGLMAAAMGETQIVLSWTAPTHDGGADISGYRIEWSDDDDGPWTVLVADTGSTSTSYTDTVTAGTSRWYRVFAINSFGPGAVSPTPVSGVSGGALTVAWESNNPPAEHRGGTGVDLLIAFSEDITGSGSDRKTAGAVVTNAAVEQFRRTVSGENTRFTIRLKATDPAVPVTFTLPANRPCTETGAICTSGGKRLSNELEATLQPPRPPGMPTNLLGTADGETAIDLAWTAPADIGTGNIRGYRIEWSADGSTNWADLVADTGNTDTTYADEGLNPGTTRHYRVSAINLAGPGDPSVSIEASALSPLTAAFENLPASHGGDGTTFTFNVRFSEDIETNNAGMRDSGITVTNGSRTRSRRVDGQKDYWVFDISPASTAPVTIAFEVPTDCAVQAYICTIDNRPLSDKLEGTVVFQAGAPGVPESLTADAKATEIVLSWDAPLSTGGSAITGYRIELSTDAGVNWTELVASQTARSYTHGSLMAGDTRHYRVSAINANGTGTPTTPASATAGTLTASFTVIPATHDGSTVFAARIQFSEAVGISADNFRAHAVTASGGSVTGATMEADDLFEITVAPTGASDVVLSLDADQPCSEDGAICGKDTNRRLSQALEATVPGPPVVGITGEAGPVVEGGTVTFTLTRSGSAADTLTVNLNVNLQGEFGLTEGTRTFTFASTETTGTLTFATTNDDDHEPDGSVEVVVQSGAGYVVDPDNNASLVAIEDNDGGAALSGLSLSKAGTNFPVSPPFSADTITYTASVPNDVAAFTITATATDSNATVVITPADARPGAGHQVLPEVGDNTITITVTAEDEVTTKTYTVTVTRLAKWTVSIAPVTSPVIEDAETGVAFTLRRTGDLSEGLTVTVNVTESENMMCSAALGAQEVQFGANEAEKVLGADVLDICENLRLDSDSVVTATIVADDDYQIGDPGEAMVTVEDSDLQVEVAVSVSPTNPAEDAGDIEVTVRATTDQARCWFNNFDIRVSDTPTIGDGAVPGKDYSFTNAPVQFRKGTATNAARCKLVETSSGTTVGRQEWTGTLSISEDVVVEGDEQFKVLLFEGGLPEAVTVTTGERIVTIKDNDEPTWDVSVSDTSVAEAGGTSVVTVSTGGVTFPEDQTITLGLTGTATVTDDYTVGSTTLTLNEGDDSVTTTITAVNDAVADDAETILVTAMLDGAQIGDQQTITITEAATPVSTDATLSGLELNDGTNDLTLTPTFASGTTSYAASVANDIDQITVAPETTDDSATVAYLDASDAAITDADDMTEGRQVDLAEGANTIKVKVTAEDDATTQTYTVTVTRAAAAMQMPNTSLTPSPADPTPATASSVQYTITFTGEWTTTATPGGLPADAHFSPLIGGVHNDQVTFLTDGGMASAGVESMAEVGGTATLSSDVAADANALSVLHRSGNINPTAAATITPDASTTPPRG